MTLVVGRRGTELSQASVIGPLNYLIGQAWQAIALNHHVGPIGQQQTLDDSYTVWVQMLPRMSGRTPLVTDKDLAEAVTGIVYYMTKEGFSERYFSVMRPSQSGNKAPVCEILVRPRTSQDLTVGSANDTSIGTA